VATLNQAAVARVIAEHLWDAGERSDTVDSLPRDLKDKVGRALAGRVITAETLRWFVEAFSFNAGHADQVGAAFAGSQSPNHVVGTLRRPGRLVMPQRHRTLAVFEHHRVGVNGQAVGHTTVHAIAAITEAVDRFVLVPHLPNGEVRVQHGGQPGRTMPFSEDLEAQEIVLTRPLVPGETVSLRYSTHFREKGGHAMEYRRFAHGRTENVDITVTFEAPPIAIWWTVWDDYRGGSVVFEEPAQLDAEGSVHRFLTHLENAAVGFRWRAREVPQHA